MDARQNNYLHRMFCPISGQIFFHPVTLYPSGHIMEQACADRMIASNIGYPNRDNKIISYVTSYDKEEEVDAYLKQNPAAKKDQYPAYEKKHHWNQGDTRHDLQPNTISASDRARQEQDDYETAMEWSRVAEENTVEGIPVNVQQAVRDALGNRFISVSAPSVPFFETNRHSSPVYTGFFTRQAPFTMRRLSEASEIKRFSLMTDIRNLIYALQFEQGPKPEDDILGYAVRFLFQIEPLPWQKIKVVDGPKTDDMYYVLKAAIRALEQLDPQMLADEKEQRKGLYDKVNTWLGGDCSLSGHGYVEVAKWFGTTKDQPGYLVDAIVKRTEKLLDELMNELGVDAMRGRRQLSPVGSVG